MTDDFVQEVFNNYYLDFASLKKAYYAETDLLAAILASDGFQKCLMRFKDGRLDYKSAIKNIEKISRGTRIITATKYVQNDLLSTALHMAHLSACAELFNGHSFLEKNLTKKMLRLLVNQHLEQYRNFSLKELNSLFFKFHTLDAVRTMQVLRRLGLVNIKTKDIRLLGLGVGSGIKELRSLHKIASMKVNKVGNDNCLTFHSIVELYHDVIIFESDPQIRESFKQMAIHPENRLVAINGDSIAGVESLDELLAERNLLPRNFISLLRIDHRMLPDVKRFLRAMLLQVERDADLVITIGQGHTLEQFQARMKKIREIFDILSEVGMKPVLIKLHTDKKLKGGVFQQVFGTREITTFQILHCKLSPELAGEI